MACILHIETSTKNCSLAVSREGKAVFYRKNTDNQFSHAACLGVFAEDAVRELAKQNLKPDAVSVSEGPGSYTGLRIGVSEAKGLCYGFDIPLIAVPTLEILYNSAMKSGINADYYCPMIDARRMEVYSCIYDKNGHIVRKIQADIVDENSYHDFLSIGKVAFFGDGSYKCEQLISSDNAIFIPDIFPDANEMIPLAEKAFQGRSFVDTVYFEPFYLKEFQATVAKNKVIPK